MESIKISRDLYIPIDNIGYYVGYTSNSVKKKVREMRKENKVLDMTCGKKINSAIFLKSGEVILSSVALETIHSRFSK